MKRLRYSLVFILLLGVSGVHAERYLCEIGIVGGGSYYVGDANPSIFQHIQPAYGAIFRYKFDSRWVLAAKGMHSNIVYSNLNTTSTSDITTIDVSAEFNFFKIERSTYDRMAKTYSPYLSIGLGAAVYTPNKVGLYTPLTFGFKWNIAPLVNMHVEWQHQFYLTDNLEGADNLNDSYNLNGSNFLRNDLFSTFTLGLSINFWKEKKICKMCNR